ncbi:MAG: carbohydrate kinase family protein, partial [bacterium]|nr:carbohydrate kinase family protein [bacterium]
IGADYYGQQILDVYRKEKVSQEFVKIHKNQPTNYQLVLTYQAERTILIKQQHYQYHDFGKIREVGWLYLSSLAGDNLAIHQKLGKYLKKHPEIKMGFNPATYEIKMGARKLAELYQQTYVLFVNFEEAQKILQNSPRAKSRREIAKALFKGLHKLGPKIIAITDGPAGAYGSDGESQYFMPKYPDPSPPVSRTGAGDAFSTAFMAALIYGLPVSEALRWGPINSMNVVQHVGAQTGQLKKPELLRLLRRAPKHYQPKII